LAADLCTVCCCCVIRWTPQLPCRCCAYCSK
jgi:hypothetical protein